MRLSIRSATARRAGQEHEIPCRAAGVPGRLGLSVVAAACGLILASCGGGGGPKPPGGVRNVILISLDTLRADRIGSYGYPLPTTPNLDAFSRRAVRFDDCMAASSFTVSSHKAILSGRHPVSFLKAYSEANTSPEPMATAFDYFIRAFHGWTSPPLAQRLRTSGMQTLALTDGGYMRPNYGFTDGFGDYRSERRGLGYQAREAEKWLRTNAERPFFLFLHCYDVHCPYDHPPKFLAPFESSCEGRLKFKGNCGHAYFDRLGLTAEEKQHIGRHYDAGVRQADHELGRFLAFLEKSGRFEDTLIVVTSDHGEDLGEHGMIGHGMLTEVELRVPLLVYMPGIVPGTVSAPVAGVDVTPTILDILGVPVGAELDGWSLRGLIEVTGRGPAAAERRELATRLSERPRFASSTVIPVRPDLTRLRAFAVRDRSGFKLLREIESGQAELYDLTRDPAEATNLAGQGRPEEAELYRLLLLHDAGPLAGIAAVAPVRGTQQESTSDRIEELRSLGYVK